MSSSSYASSRAPRRPPLLYFPRRRPIRHALARALGFLLKLLGAEGRRARAR